MSSKAYDTNQPILVVIRRGRGGRGYTVAPVDDLTDIAACADVEQIGDAVVEMLDDENQPRVDIDSLMRAADGDIEDQEGESKSQDLEESENEDEDDDEEEDEDDEPWYKSVDPADALILTGISKLIEKGRKVSRSSRRRRGRGRKGKRA